MNLAPMKFEYTTDALGSNAEAAEAKLKEMGREGWELVTVCPVTIFGFTSSLVAFFKRPLTGDSDA